MSAILNALKERFNEAVDNTEDAIAKVIPMDRQILDTSNTTVLSIDPNKFIPGRLRSAVGQLTELLKEIDNMGEGGSRDSLRNDVTQKIRDYNTKILSYERNFSSTYHA